MISKHIFRAYDIRGIAFDELSEDAVFNIAKALGTIIRENNHKQVVVARDGRLSGPTLMKALQKGLLSSGCDVIDIGKVPTPILYFANYHLKIPNGIMMTGSHNPTEYNGLKIIINNDVFCGDDIQNVYARIQNTNFTSGEGSLSKQSVVEAYFSRILGDVKLSKKLKVVIDCGNGIAGNFAPQLFSDLGCEVIPLFCEVDGNFPNHHPDPTRLENLIDLRAAIAEHQADVGLAFDGDGDRLGLLTNKGELIWPDRQLMLHAKDILERNPKSTIVFDVKCTNNLPEVVAQFGGEPIMWKTGHSFIKSKMKEVNALLGGEMSGHFFFKERWYGFDDGLYTAARTLEILSNTDKTIDELFAEFPDSINTPELKLELEDDYKFKFIDDLIKTSHFADAKLNTVDGLRADFEHGWGLVRASNTTPCVIFRFEASNDAELKNIQTVFRGQVLSVNDKLELPF